ncbi:MAG: hypothetical protein ACRDHB_10255 [Actinomycetota bacterium]
MNAFSSADRPVRAAAALSGGVWLPLLQQLTKVIKDGGVWKNAEDALEGTGDVDYTAPPGRWSLIREEFRRWAGRVAAHPVLVCRHIPFTMLAVAVDRERRELLQLDVRSRLTFRGSTLVRASELPPLMVMDADGFRRLRPGAEGVLKLVHKGLGMGGRPKWPRLRDEQVEHLLRSDPQGVREAVELLGTRNVLRGASALAAGQWNRRAMVLSDLLFTARAVLEPATALQRLRFRLVERDRCPIVVATTRNARRIPEPVDRWVRLAERHHPDGTPR